MSETVQERLVRIMEDVEEEMGVGGLSGNSLYADFASAVALRLVREMFSADDVRHVRAAAEQLPADTLRRRALESHADRIAALLPPRDA